MAIGGGILFRRRRGDSIV